MLNPIIRAYEARLDVADGERSVVAKINTDAIDRYRTLIDPAGVDLSNYRNNPVVLWMHGCGNDGKPVARCAWIRYLKAERAIVAKSIFLEDEFSDGVFRLYQQEVLRSFSVNIVPKAGGSSAPTADEIRKRPDLADCWMCFRQSDLAEFSAVNVPGNPEALALAVSRGLWMPDELRAMKPAPAPKTAPVPGPEPEPDSQLPRITGRTLAEATAARIHALRHTLPAEARKAAQDRLDLLRGRV